MSRLALANPIVGGADDRYFIFCYFEGGWDILLSLDPRDPLVFNSGAVQATQILPGYEFLESSDGALIDAGGITLGPHAGGLANVMEHVAIVRGMSMDTLTHEAGRRRFLTGKVPSGLQARGSSGATWLASKLGVDNPIPNLAVKVESYNVDQPNYATGMIVNSVPDLVAALRDAEPTQSKSLDQLVDGLLGTYAQCTSVENSAFLTAAEAGRLKAREMVQGGYEQLFDFLGDPAAIDAFNIPLGESNPLATPEAQAAMAVTAITSGMSRVVSIEAASGLDTHYDEWTTDQGPAQERGFDVIASMIQALKGKAYPGGQGESWLDHVTIVGFSEFCRGALLNANLGRDHSLTNACVVAGAGIQGNQVIGSSSDVGMTPTRTNLETGVTVEFGNAGGEVVRPEHVLQALLHDVGVTDDEADLRVEPLKALLKNPS